MFEMKDRGCSPEDALRLAATLISENLMVREIWVEEHKGLVEDWSKQTNLLEKINYVAISCFAPIYIVNNTFTRLSMCRGCIHAIHPLKDLESFIRRVQHFPTSGFVLFKRVNNYFEEIPYVCGYTIDTKEKVLDGLVLPLPPDSKFWVEVNGQRFECDAPKFQSATKIEN